MENQHGSITSASRMLIHLIASAVGAHFAIAFDAKTLPLAEMTDDLALFRAVASDERSFTWWMPAGADAYVLPVSAGIRVEASDKEMMERLRNGSPWDLRELPVLGGLYRDRTLAVIVPWPHYAELIVTDRVGVRFKFPEGRNNTTPCDVVARWAGSDALEVARVFREWRRNAEDIGGLARPRPLARKARELPRVNRLFGAAHFYLWGPAMFSRHDVDRRNWIPLAQALRAAPKGSFGARLRSLLSDEERKALDELAEAEWPMKHLTLTLALAFDRALVSRVLLGQPDELSVREVAEGNREALAMNLAEFVHDPKTWGDGLSCTLLEEMHGAGIEQAVLLLSDLYGTAVRPDAVARAAELGYLLGPYDSYHSVHSPSAHPDRTWETAQFDREAYEKGRVVKAEGRRQGGFKGRGFHFAPVAAWPYVLRRVGTVLGNNAYSCWFVDCDATAECFDDFSPLHPMTRVEDMKARRQRLRWLETDRRLVIGSEGGSALFADVIHFGHGVHTPYLGHLDPAFRDRQSPHFLGRHWPPDTPEQSFKAVPVPPSLRSPYFDPRVRIPLYRAALGDELIVSHHWSFDSLKFSDVEAVRALMEILYLVPPMYHLNRETWPERREKILRQVGFWGPLHRQLAQVPLSRFDWLTDDRMVQRTTFGTGDGEVAITVNFSTETRVGFPPLSASVTGPIDVARERPQPGSNLLYRFE